MFYLFREIREILDHPVFRYDFYGFSHRHFYISVTTVGPVALKVVTLIVTLRRLSKFYSLRFSSLLEESLKLVRGRFSLKNSTRFSCMSKAIILDNSNKKLRLPLPPPPPPPFYDGKNGAFCFAREFIIYFYLFIFIFFYLLFFFWGGGGGLISYFILSKQEPITRNVQLPD